MSPSRRSFLRALLALPIAATLDVEKLLWVPGQQIVVPAMPVHLFEPRYYDVSVPISIEDINAVTMAEFVPAVLDNYFKVDPLIQYLKGDRFSITVPAARPSWERAQ